MGADAALDWRRAAASALAWWQDAGVDLLVGDEPRDWLAAPPPVPARPPAVASAAPAEAPLPGTLAEFLAYRMADERPEAAWPASRIAPAGTAGAPILILVDMPQEDDDPSTGLLSGPAGQLLDSMLSAIGLSRESAFLASVCLARPLAGRGPSDSVPELHRLARHLVTLAAPERLLLLGEGAARAFSDDLDRAPGRGLRDIKVDGRSLPAVATLHPRFLLERPAAKAETWKHLQLLVGIGGQ